MRNKMIWALMFAASVTSHNLIAGGEHKHQHDSKMSSVGMPAKASASTRVIKVITKDTMRYQFSETLDLNQEKR